MPSIFSLLISCVSIVSVEDHANLGGTMRVSRRSTATYYLFDMTVANPDSDQGGFPSLGSALVVLVTSAKLVKVSRQKSFHGQDFQYLQNEIYNLPVCSSLRQLGGPFDKITPVRESADQKLSLSRSVSETERNGRYSGCPQWCSPTCTCLYWFYRVANDGLQAQLAHENLRRHLWC